MVKKNKLLIGCLALLLVLSVGYALFSETITINGTATAKGNFDMVAECTSGISSRLGTAESLGLNKEGGYDSDSCTVNNNVVSASVNFNNIGVPKYFTVKITNNGSIDAVLDMSKITKEITTCSSASLDTTTFTSDMCSTSKGDYLLSGLSAGDFDLLASNDFPAISNENDNILSSSETGVYFDFQNSILTLPPKYSVYMILKFSVNHLPNSTTNIMNVKITTSIKLPFVQAQ